MKITRTVNLHLLFLIFLIASSFYPLKAESYIPDYSLKFSRLAATWDEAIPLGNGALEALIWQKGDNLRFSLDKSDLWDLRPMENLSKPEFNFKWVQKQVENNNYQVVQELFDGKAL